MSVVKNNKKVTGIYFNNVKYRTIVFNNKIYYRDPHAPNMKPVGGKIFYVDTASAGTVNYTFYDRNGNSIGTNLTDLEVLKNAWFYSANGSETVSRYYVVATTDGTPNGGIGYYQNTSHFGVNNSEAIGCTSTSDGKGNTDVAISVGLEKGYIATPQPVNLMYGYFYNGINTRHGGHTDGFIPAMNQLDKLVKSTIYQGYDTRNIGSSTEYGEGGRAGTTYASSSGRHWYGMNKGGNYYYGTVIRCISGN